MAGVPIKVPGLGDIDEVEVIEICVRVGDTISEGDALIVIESDKASMDVPSDVSGTLASIDVAIGEKVSEGMLIAVIESDAEDAPEETTSTLPPLAVPQEGRAEPQHDRTADPVAPSPEAHLHMLEVMVPDIGDATGVVVIEVAIQPGQQVEINDLLVVLESDKASMEISAETAGEIVEVCVVEGDEVEQGSLIAKVQVLGADVVKEPDIPPAAEPLKPPRREPEQTPASPQTSDAGNGKAPTERAQVYAGPATRRLARELGVNLADVVGTGQRNRILKDDVKTFVKARLTEGSPPTGSGSALPAVPEVDFSRFGPVRSLPLSRIRQRGAVNLKASWVNLPHVTQHDDADITDLENFRQSLKDEAQNKGVRITPLAFIVKACCKLLKAYPEFNASLHPGGEELILKDYINIGIAVDTPEGLVVPVIKAADEKDIWTLSEEIAVLAEKARDKKLDLEDLAGGTFSISSLGALGGTGFTPIVNAPEVAILGVAKLATRPVWQGEQFVPRKILPLSLSYDHRVINGADGGRFMVDLIEYLRDIRRLAL